MRRCLTYVLLIAGFAGAGCNDDDVPQDYVARVGNEVFTEEDLAQALEGLNPGQDTTEVVHQIVEQWVTNELLYQEAQRQRLSQDEEVQRRLQENERSVLIDVLVSRLYDEETAEPSVEEMQAYFERNKEQLRLREPFVRVHYLAVADPDSAATARTLLREAVAGGTVEANWPALMARFGTDPTLSRTLAANFIPESRLLNENPGLRDRLPQMRPGEIAPLFSVGNRHYVVHLAERMPAGTLPELAWIEDEVRQRVIIQARKQMYARQVQRLRNEALAREALEMP